MGWLLLGSLALLATVPSVWAARSVGGPPASGEDHAQRGLHGIWPTVIAYTIFGAGYFGYMTFIVALYHANGFSELEITAMWSALGLASLASLYPWAKVISRSRGGYGLAAILATVAAGVAVPLCTSSRLGAFASAILFGGSMVSVITATTSLARRYLPQRQWSAAITVLTVGAAAGQCAGPVVVGGFADHGGIRAGLGLSLILLTVATCVAIGQTEPKSQVITSA